MPVLQAINTFHMPSTPFTLCVPTAVLFPVWGFVSGQSAMACIDIACMITDCLCHFDSCNQPAGYMQAEMSEDEGHSQGGSDDDADEDGDLVSRLSPPVCILLNVTSTSSTSCRGRLVCCKY